MTDRGYIPITAPVFGEEERAAILEPLESGWVTQGPKVAAFEEAFARRAGARRAVATSNCTTALHLALAALGIGPGDEVILPSFTWVSCAHVVVHLGATPVLADIDLSTFNLDPAEVKRLLSPRTRAVMAVHLFGLCADVDAIAAAAPGVPILEDAACAAGAVYKGRPAGSLGRAAAFSFHGRKIITTGEGGMVTTDDEALAERVTCLRNHGASVPEEARHRSARPYDMPSFPVVGYNVRMTDFQAALGLAQLTRLDALLAGREEGAAHYRRELEGIGWLALPETPPGGRHGWQSYVVRVDERAAGVSRDEIMAKLEAMGIASRPGTHAIHTLEAYASRLGLAPEDLPASFEAARTALTLPLHARMEPSDFTRVAEALRSIAAKG